ncbi:S9 family peptidase [Maribacter ulvicola]|uniref:Dipeptidyl-peptidase-4 n=1 Tax=Maribacter ulvicola TaxID=228959 RepID=A0A1N6Q108_9FLAO|nr:DPP IV N-terminal domain-containing protein [Maribacter ulvicola]SIQ10215.1 dipeptidyl-peptidase-4 [Maribacter ulvicola]
MSSTLQSISFLLSFLAFTFLGIAQKNDSLLNLDRIYVSKEFKSDRLAPLFWVEDGNAFVTIEKSENGNDQLIKYRSKDYKSDVYLSTEKLTSNGVNLKIEDFSLSPDGSKVMIFTNSSRVWRTNSKGDFWVYDFDTDKLKKLGKDFSPSSLMFAKFSDNNQFVAYVKDFNIYKENFKTGEITPLTTDGTGAIINGTFDWVYEEEFGVRDGFTWSPDASKIAFWQLDASEIGTFYMINNTDSVYAEPISVQYPKAGFNPSSAKLGLINTKTSEINWIPVPGDPAQHYLPAMQWVNKDVLLIQQMNRKQNELNVYTYRPSSNKLRKIYTETEDTWVDLRYPDIASNHWGNNDQLIVDNGKSFLRMTENDGWRHMYKISLETGKKTLVTPGNYDVAAYYQTNAENLYIVASPNNATQRYLYSVPLNGAGKLTRITPAAFGGVNSYDVSLNGEYAIHKFTDVNTPNTLSLVSLPKHKTIQKLVDNKQLKNRLKSLAIPETSFFKVTTKEGIVMDGRMTKPLNFNESKKYPVLFHVYGEPWGVVATDQWIGLYEIYMAQKGFVVINIDNRGTPSLKGSEWRKSIYQKLGVLNSRDQALAAQKVLKTYNFLDKDRVNVWGWSGGGSMTQNLLFRYPEIYKTGVAVAGVANQLLYDNIYQERYMGLPNEDKDKFIEGSPITYAKNLKGNLLLIHGTGDDNVHYQNMELLVNELIRNNKEFEMMAYPNRSHGIYEGQGTSLHLYTLITNYFLKHNKFDNN